MKLQSQMEMVQNGRWAEWTLEAAPAAKGLESLGPRLVLRFTIGTNGPGFPPGESIVFGTGTGRAGFVGDPKIVDRKGRESLRAIPAVISDHFRGDLIKAGVEPA